MKCPCCDVEFGHAWNCALNQPDDKAAPYPQLRTIKITICQACLNGEGQECHTPGCALFLHRVDLPIHPGMYEDVTDEGVFIAPDAERIEREAIEVYNTWDAQPGWVPWVERGNSDKQYDARRIARQNIASANGSS